MVVVRAAIDVEVVVEVVVVVVEVMVEVVGVERVGFLQNKDNFKDNLNWLIFKILHKRYDYDEIFFSQLFKNILVI